MHHVGRGKPAISFQRSIATVATYTGGRHCRGQAERFAEGGGRWISIGGGNASYIAREAKPFPRLRSQGPNAKVKPLSGMRPQTQKDLA